MNKLLLLNYKKKNKKISKTHVVDSHSIILGPTFIQHLNNQERHKYYKWISEIHKIANKPDDYNWKNGNGFLGAANKKPLDKDIAKDILINFKKVVEKNKLIFWLEGGTLLGAVRNKDFIDYDTDIDVRIYYNDIPKLIKSIPELKENGLDLLRTSNNEITFIKNGEYIDIEFIKSPTKYTKELDTINFLNTDFKIPKYIDEYLTIMYGDWRTPNKYHSLIVPGT